MSLSALVVGFGSVGRRHLENLRALGVGDLRVVRTGRSTLPEDEQTRSALIGVTLERDLDAALAKKPGVAVIANPTAVHVETATRCARAGCDLFIEKPLGASMEGVEALVREVRSRSLVAMIGCQFRFHPLLESLRGMIGGKVLGRGLFADAEWGEWLPGWHPWEDHRQSYAAREDLGGGALRTLIHPFDYLWWLLGPFAGAEGVVAKVAALETGVADDVAEVAIKFASGAAGRVHLDFFQRPPRHRLRVVCEGGSAALDFLAGTLTTEAPDGSHAVHCVPEPFTRNDMFIAEMREFLSCVETRRVPRVSLQDGIDVLRWVMAVREKATGVHS